MDYGIRLFRHVFQQVFGNLGHAAKISLVPGLILAVAIWWAMQPFQAAGVSFLALQQIQMTGQGPDLTEEQLLGMANGGLRILVASLLGVVLFSWVAVAWHRFVLAEEYPGLMPQFSTRRVLGYVGRSFLIGLLVLLVMIPAMFVLSGLVLASPGFAVLLGLGVHLLAGWLFVRWGVILPACSVDRKMTIGESWGATKEVSGEILVPIIGFAVIFAIVQQVIGLGGTGLAFVIAASLVFWIQMLVNLSLLTTLFGSRVEGRDLN